MARKATGTVTPRPDGRFWARAPRQSDGSRPSLGIFATREEAEQAVTVSAAIKFTVSGVPTFAKYGATVLDIREKDDGIRGIEQERRRFKLHLAAAPFASKPLDKITPADVLNWIRKLARTDAKDNRAKRKLSKHTVQRCLALCAAIFQEAIGVHVDGNPCVGLRVKSDARAATVDKWDYLRAEEQTAILTCPAIPEYAKCMMAFAWSTGLRQGEMWNLEIRDVHVDGPKPFIKVRYGSKGKAPKNGRTRNVRLFGAGLWAAKTWLELLPMITPAQECKPHLMWPTVNGYRRQSGAPERTERIRDTEGNLTGKFKKIDLLDEWLRMAGITRHLRWHDLRHTCCTSLVSGFWGEPWTLDETKDHAGHSDISVTQRYAHFADSARDRAVAKVDNKPFSVGVH